MTHTVLSWLNSILDQCRRQSFFYNIWQNIFFFYDPVPEKLWHTILTQCQYLFNKTCIFVIKSNCFPYFVYTFHLNYFCVHIKHCKLLLVIISCCTLTSNCFGDTLLRTLQQSGVTFFINKMCVTTFCRGNHHMVTPLILYNINKFQVVTLTMFLYKAKRQ